MQGSDERFDIAISLKLIKPTNRADDPLPDFTADPAVFNNLQVLIAAGLLDACKHGVSLIEDTM